MTAPAKAAPMREDVTPLIMMLRATTVEEGCVVFEHSPEEIGWAVMEAHNEVLARLAHTARPDAVSMDAKADNMEARPDAGDEDVERVARAIYNEDNLDGLGEHTKSVMMDRARAALAAMREGVDRGMVEPLDWLTQQHNVSVSYHYPWRCDDDDQSEEWRVTRENGGVNDREWTVIGTGSTAREAIANAAALSPEQPR